MFRIEITARGRGKGRAYTGGVKCIWKWLIVSFKLGDRVFRDKIVVLVRRCKGPNNERTHPFMDLSSRGDLRYK